MTAATTMTAATAMTAASAMTASTAMTAATAMTTTTATARSTSPTTSMPAPAESPVFRKRSITDLGRKRKLNASIDDILGSPPPPSTLRHGIDNILGAPDKENEDDDWLDKIAQQNQKYKQTMQVKYCSRVG